jgi:signal transduction histidine kinase
VGNVSATVSRHKCLIYEGHPSEQLPVIVPFLLEGLKGRRRCIYMGPPEMVSMVEKALSREGLDLRAERARRALELSSDRGHLKDGKFDPDAMVASWGLSIDQAVQEGFSGLCATADMRWELGDDRNFDRLLEYEAKVEQAFSDKPLDAVCQYHVATVPKRSLHDAFLTHRSIYVGEHLDKDNYFFIPPELLTSRVDTRDKQGEWLYRQIARVISAERERDEALAALRKLNEELEKQVGDRTADLEAFSYSVSHDLRAPLRSIDGFAHRLRERIGKKLDPESNADLGRVLDAADRMRHLIDGMMELAWAGRGSLEIEPVGLSSLAESIVSELRHAEPVRKVEVRIEPKLTARGDPRLLEAALRNLLHNAWKFTSKTNAARIEFGAAGPDGSRQFYVKDNGAGFEMALIKRLFHPFERLHPRSEFPGTGVGLATVSRIIKRHGGEVSAEGAVGKGAAFYFTLPDG